MFDHNVAALHEAVAAAVGERDCIVWRDRRLSWADVTDRSRRLAAVLRRAGLGTATVSPGGASPGSPGGATAGAATEPWESPHDHVALYLHNGNEYLEGMLGAWKARCAPVNVNYRYVAGELAYVLRDSCAAAIVFHGRFAETLAAVLPELRSGPMPPGTMPSGPGPVPHVPRSGARRPGLPLLLQVDDGSGAPRLPEAFDYEEALAAVTPTPPVELSPDDRYILYTGGTTGMPKGVLWRQGDFLATCLGVDGSAEEIVAAARSRTDLRVLPSAPFMHGAAHWNAISAWVSGGTIVIQDDPTRLVPADVLGTCARELVTGLQIVGDAFARPLLDELESGDYELSTLRRLLSGGATLSAAVKARLTDLLPQLRIVDVLGSSETGRQAVAQTTSPIGHDLSASDRAPVAGRPGERRTHTAHDGSSESNVRRAAAVPGRSGAGGEGAFVPSADAVVLSEDRTRRLSPGDHEAGWLAQRGRVPLGYLGDPDKTRAAFPVIDGVRYAVSGDRVRLLADGRIAFLGRESVTINTGGEKVFAEEVETVLTAHPAVADAIVVGRSNPRWGQEVVAVVSPRDGTSAPDPDALRAHCRAQLAGYKVPKAFLWVDQVRRSPTGKADYAWAHEVVDAGGASDASREDHEQR